MVAYKLNLYSSYPLMKLCYLKAYWKSYKEREDGRVPLKGCPENFRKKYMRWLPLLVHLQVTPLPITFPKKYHCHKMIFL